MLTFDEAVEATFKEDEAHRVHAFFKEAAKNEVILRAVDRAMRVVAIGASPPDVAMLSFFLCGVAVGRAMEKQELPQV